MKHRDPVTAAIRAAREDPCPRLQVANGFFVDTLPVPDSTAADSAAADAVKAAWEPMHLGQKVPMIGERVDVEPCLPD